MPHWRLQFLKQESVWQHININQQKYNFNFIVHLHSTNVVYARHNTNVVYVHMYSTNLVQVYSTNVVYVHSRLKTDRQRCNTTRQVIGNCSMLLNIKPHQRGKIGNKVPRLSLVASIIKGANSRTETMTLTIRYRFDSGITVCPDQTGEDNTLPGETTQIGRASCRERV